MDKGIDQSQAIDSGSREPRSLVQDFLIEVLSEDQGKSSIKETDQVLQLSPQDSPQELDHIALEPARLQSI